MAWDTQRASLREEACRDKLPRLMLLSLLLAHSADSTWAPGSGEDIPPCRSELYQQQHNKQPLPGLTIRWQAAHWYFTYLLGNRGTTLQDIQVDVKSVPKHTLSAMHSSLWWMERGRDFKFLGQGQRLAHLWLVEWMWASYLTFLVLSSLTCKTGILKFWPSESSLTDSMINKIM